jgi:DNA polymerase elongation subunit (family B)
LRAKAAPKPKAPSAVGKPKAKKKKKAPPKVGYGGARVIHPTRRGLLKEPIYTLDYGSLYPSICRSRRMCYTTMLTSKTIKKWGLERWQYSKFILGLAEKTACGEACYDPKAAAEKGYHSPHLKVAYFYSAEIDETVYGIFIKKMKALRKVAKDKMAAAKASKEDILVHLDSKGTVPLAKGSRQEKMLLEEGVPLPLIQRTFEIEEDTYNNTQESFKIVNNSGYGFSGVSPDKAMLPCMEIAAGITSVGRYELLLAKSVAQRVVGLSAKDYLEARNEVLERESIVDSNNSKKRVNRSDGKPYNAWKLDPEYVSNNSLGGRKPLVDCSDMALLSDAWIYESRHGRMSQGKNDVIYGDTCVCKD